MKAMKVQEIRKLAVEEIRTKIDGFARRVDETALPTGYRSVD